MHILSVDDRADNRYLMETLAKGHGHRISSANNGREALQILHAEPVDLIISDILMPVMDGFQLCREVKADPALCHIPVIIYTATYTGPQDEAFALKIGASKFLIKPCEPLQLITIIEELYQTRTNEPQQPIRQENGNEVLKLYNERLVRNLEMKTQQLEKEATARHLAATSHYITVSGTPCSYQKKMGGLLTATRHLPICLATICLKYPASALNWLPKTKMNTSGS